MYFKPPIFLFAFAQDQDKSLRLGKELTVCLNELEQLDDEGVIKCRPIGFPTLEYIYKQLNFFNDRIYVFHYGGHSKGEILQLPMGSASSVNLGLKFSQLKNLKLVFLNGCKNYEQVSILHNYGIPAIIATSADVEDERAIDLAQQFYQALAGGYSIEDAFESARAFIFDKYPELKTNYRGIGFSGKAPSEDFAWGLYLKDKSSGTWKIDQLRDQKAKKWKIEKISYSESEKVVFIHILTSDNRKIVEQQNIQEFLNPYLRGYEEKIINLQEKLDDKIKITSLLDREVRYLSIEMERLLNDKEVVERQVISLIELLQKEELTNKDKEYHEAINLILTGDLEKAKDLLTEEKLNKEGDSLQAQLIEYAEKRRLKGYLLRIEGDFEEAERNFLEATEKNPSFLNFLSLGLLYSEVKNWENAFDTFENCLEYTSNNRQIAGLYTNLATAKMELMELDDAQNYFQQSLELWENIAHEEPSNKTNDDLFIIYNNLALLKNKREDLESAKVYFEKANNALSAQKINEGKVFNSHLIIYLNNYAILLQRIGELDQSERLLRQALEEVNKISNRGSFEYIDYCASIYGNLGSLYEERRQFVLAKQYLHKAIDILEDIVQRNPIRCLPAKARHFCNLGTMYLETKDIKNAEKYLQAAFAIQESIVLDNPNNQIYSELANTLNALGSFYMDNNDFEAAYKSILSAIELQNSLYEKSSQSNFLLDWSRSQNRLGDLFDEMELWGEAEKAYQNTLYGFKSLLKLAPKNKQYLLGQLFALLSVAKAQSKRLKSSKIKVAKNNSKKAEKLILELIEEYGENTYFLYQKAQVNEKIALLKSEINKSPTIPTIRFRKAVEILRRLILEVGDQYLTDLAQTLSFYAVHAGQKEKDYPKAEELFLESLNIQRQLIQNDKEQHFPLLAGTLNNFAVIKIEQNQINLAETYYLESLDLFESLYEKKHFDIIKYYLSTKINLSRLYQERLNNEVDSKKHANDIIRLVTNYPDAHPFKRFLFQAEKILDNWN